MLRSIKCILIIIIFLISSNVYYCQIKTVGSKDSNYYLWKITDEYIKRYEQEVISVNKRIIQRKINKLKLNDTNLGNGIKFVINSINDSLNKNFDNMPNILCENNSLHTNNIDHSEEYFGLFKDVENFFEIKNIIFNDQENQQKERALQLYRGDINETMHQTQQRYFPNLNFNSEYNTNAYPNQMNYYGNRGITFTQSQQNVIKQPALSGLLSVTNPAFKMIVSTVLMCLGSTPYGAIAVLVVVTVYTLIEIVFKYFYNKTKNKNILNSIQRVSNINTMSNISRKTYNLTSNSVHPADKTPINRSLRNLMKNDNYKIPKDIVNEICNSIRENNYESSRQRKKLDFFSNNLFEYITTIKTLNIKKRWFLDDNIIKNVTDRFMSSILDFFTDDNENITESITNNGTLSNIFEDIFYSNYQNHSKYGEIPDWYKNMCVICVSMKTENRILTGRESDDWVPINNVINPKGDYLFELNHRISEIDNFINIETEHKGNLVSNNSNINSSINNNIPKEINENEDTVFSDQIDILSHNNTTKNKWYDKMIKYSIQSYRQNGVRGVITMILDIFSTIFSATPIGYLLITLIRLIAFMTDKLLLLSRRRKNQNQLSRLLFEIPEIFNEEKLSIVLKEIGFIETECNKEEERLIKLYISYIKHLQKFNPLINMSTVSREINTFVEIIKNKNNFAVEQSNNYQSSEYIYSLGLRKLLYHNKSYENSYSESWTLNKSNQQGNEFVGKKTKDKQEKNIEITSKVIKETKYIENNENSSYVKNSFQTMIGGLKGFLLNLFKSIFGGAGELWEYIKGLLSRIIDFIKTLWDVIRGEKKKRILIEILEDFPTESTIHSCLFADIIKILKIE